MFRPFPTIPDHSREQWNTTRTIPTVPPPYRVEQWEWSRGTPFPDRTRNTRRIARRVHGLELVPVTPER